MNNTKNKKLLIIIGIIILVIIIVLLLFLFLPKESNEVAKKTTIKHSTVDQLYEDLGDPECIESCDTREYVSKLYGYTYDDDKNIAMQVKEGYIENNKVYDLDGKEIGDYTEETVNDVLDNGTLKTYNYTKDGNDYILKE